MWSLAEGFFKQNFCHACHTRFAVVFPLPSCCVSLLFLSAVTEQSWDTLKASRRRGRWERREGEKKETHLPAHALPSFYILKISRKLKKITSYADFLRRSPKNVCVGGYKRDYFGRSKPGCHGLLRVLDSDSLLAEACFLCCSEPLLAGKTVGTMPWEVKRKNKHRGWWNGLEGAKRITLAFGLWWWFQRGNFVGVIVTLELTVTAMLFCFSDMIHSLNRVEEILVKIPLDKEKQL